MTSTQDVTVQSTVDIAELLDQTVSVYPNPATDNITLSIINSINGNYNIDIVDLVGKTVYSENIAKDNTIFTKQIDLSNLSKGVYLLKYNENGNVGYKKIAIN